MPIYEYECKKCGHRCEQLQKISDAPLLICPACQTESLTKLISHTGFQLRGTGWYVTDFKNKTAVANTSETQQNKTTTTDGTAKTPRGEKSSAQATKS